MELPQGTQKSDSTAEMSSWIEELITALIKLLECQFVTAADHLFILDIIYF